MYICVYTYMYMRLNTFIFIHRPLKYYMQCLYKGNVYKYLESNFLLCQIILSTLNSKEMSEKSFEHHKLAC